MSTFTSVIKAVGGGGIKSFGDVVAVLQLAFPNVSEAISTFIGTLKSGQGIVATTKVGFQGLWSVIAAHPVVAKLEVSQSESKFTTFYSLYLAGFA